MRIQCAALGIVIGGFDAGGCRRDFRCALHTISALFLRHSKIRKASDKENADIACMVDVLLYGYIGAFLLCRFGITGAYKGIFGYMRGFPADVYSCGSG